MTLFSRMRRSCLACLLAFLPVPALAQAELPPLTISTGDENETYHRFASEFAKFVLDGIEVVPSRGSVHNLRRLLGYEADEEGRYFQLAMVQADVLEQLRERAGRDPELAKLVEKIKVVLPLYTEEVHAFTKNARIKKLTDIFDLAGKINVNSEGSGTYMTAHWIFEQAGRIERAVDFATNVEDDGLPSLGRSYDVVLQVAGAPSRLGQSIVDANDISLVEIDLPEIYARENSPYVPTIIRAGTYPWLREDVHTVAVRALLVAFDYPETNPYCAEIEKLTRAIVTAQQKLTESGYGHPKWREFDPASALERSDLYVCAERALRTR